MAAKPSPPRSRICVLNFVLDRAVVVIDGMTPVMIPVVSIRCGFCMFSSQQLPLTVRPQIDPLTLQEVADETVAFTLMLQLPEGFGP